MAKRGKVHDYYHRLHRADSTQNVSTAASKPHIARLQI